MFRAPAPHQFSDPSVCPSKPKVISSGRAVCISKWVGAYSPRSLTRAAGPCEGPFRTGWRGLSRQGFWLMDEESRRRRVRICFVGVPGPFSRMWMDDVSLYFRRVSNRLT
ncbi:hypothetical protein JTE90_021786 [Oedothorax gibbosus]|uniref:Uncharacterized protein n=1 Tax=Oedothorax gibbosus TaxID=931172 RepID=A0AAV6THB7_9ARAC|nr:hypothetical protein JTE90_021786 [Oedothorax gibbosus]